MTYPRGITPARTAAACAVTGLAVVLLLSSPYGVHAQGTPGSLPAAQPIASASGTASRRRVRLHLAIGACTKRIDVSKLVERSQSVRIALTQERRAGPCPDNLVEYCVQLTLRKPLDNRRIVDLSRTRSVKRESPAVHWATGPCHLPGPVPKS